MNNKQPTKTQYLLVRFVLCLGSLCLPWEAKIHITVIKVYSDFSEWVGPVAKQLDTRQRFHYRFAALLSNMGIADMACWGQTTWRRNVRKQEPNHYFPVLNQPTGKVNRQKQEPNSYFPVAAPIFQFRNNRTGKYFVRQLQQNTAFPVFLQFHPVRTLKF